MPLVPLGDELPEVLRADPRDLLGGVRLELEDKLLECGPPRRRKLLRGPDVKSHMTCLIKISRNELGTSGCATDGHTTTTGGSATEGQEELHGNAGGSELWHGCTTTGSCTTSAATIPKEFSATSIGGALGKVEVPGSCTGVEVAIGGASGASGASVGLLPPEVAPLGAAGGETSSGLSSCTITPLLSTYERRRALLHSDLASSAGCAMTACSRLSVDEEPDAIGRPGSYSAAGLDTDTVITTFKVVISQRNSFSLVEGEEMGTKAG